MGPEGMKASFLRMAKAYEELAKDTEQPVTEDWLAQVVPLNASSVSAFRRAGFCSPALASSISFLAIISISGHCGPLS
jgi:hypothetical protein